MNGILVVDKPAGITSHDVVSRVRQMLKTKRVGHTGTLDPFATGVMVILVGKATRLAQFLDKDEKEYEATVRFGYETDTGDLTGTPTIETDQKATAALLRDVDWEEVLPAFRGEIEQVPPMYSAKKVGGKKLYEHARRGETIERKPVRVRVSSLSVNSSSLTPRSLDLRVTCSAGTYIRTLAEDIGRKIGVGAHVAALRRTRAGAFSIGSALTLEHLESVDDPSSALVSMENAVYNLPKFHLSEERVDKTKNGLPTRVISEQFENEQAVRMLSPDGKLIAIGQFEPADNVVEPKVVLI